MIFFLLFLLLSAAPAWAITWDATTRVAASSTSSISTNHTIGGSCTNTLVAASLGFFDNGGLTVSSFTIGGSAATHIATETGVNRATTAYYRVGHSGTVAVAVTLSGGSDKLSLSVRSYCNVHQTVSIGTAVKDFRGDTSTDPPSLVVSSAVGELVIDFGLAKNNNDNTLTVGASQTERLNTDSNGGYFTHFESEEAGAASVTMSWSQVMDYLWTYIAVPLKPETPPAPPSGGRRRLTQGSMSD